MNARYYLPETGRFISPDTLVPEPSNPQSLNRYTYALNSSVNYTDPSGHGVFLGIDTAGTWSLYFDGTPIPGLKGEDIHGF